MSPADVLARLERDAGKVLRDARRDGQEHQRTVQATVEWSCELLSPQERELFDRLSVFAGSFDLEAVEAACAGGVVDEFDAADLLDGLVDQSLVSLADPASTRSRYRMLEPIRQYADQSLADRNRRLESHARHFYELAQIGYEAMWTGAEAEWIERLEADFANHRVAYQYWADRGELSEALTIAITLNQLGELALQRPAGAEVLFATLDLDGIETHELGPIAMAHAATAFARRQNPQAQQLAMRAVQLAATPKARWESALWAHAATASLVANWAWDVGLSRDAMIAQVVEFAADIPEPRARLISEGYAAMHDALYGDLDRVTERLQNIPNAADSSLVQGFLTMPRVLHAERTGNPRLALDLALDTVNAARQAGNRWVAGVIVLGAAPAATEVLEPDELLQLLSEFMPAWRQANDINRLGWSLLYCAHGLAAFGDDELAAQLLGATDHTLREADRPMHDQLRAMLDKRLGRQQFDQLVRRGSQRHVIDLADEVQEHIDRHT